MYKRLFHILLLDEEKNYTNDQVYLYICRRYKIFKYKLQL
jgi:hypothetical protein